MPNCPHCNQPVAIDAERCAQCGAWLADAPKADPQALEDSVRALMAQGEKIQAIKLYREQTGVGLAEAKQAVEQIEQGHSAPDRPPVAGDLEQQILDLMAAGEKIAAIKLHREQTHSGLKEAKEAVEELAARHGIVTPANAGCFGVLVLSILASIALIGWAQ